MEDIRRNLARCGNKSLWDNFYEFLEIYENSKGLKGFVKINKKMKSKSKIKKKNKSLPKPVIPLSPTKSADVNLNFQNLPSKLTVPKEFPFNAFKFSFSPVASQESKIFESCIKAKINKTNVSSPKVNMQSDLGKSVKKRKNSKIGKINKLHSGRVRNTSPYLESIYGLPQVFPTLEKSNLQQKMISLKLKNKIYDNPTLGTHYSGLC